MPLFTCSMQFVKVSKVKVTGGAITPVKLFTISTHCGLLLVTSNHLNRRYFSLFRRKLFIRLGSMTASRGSSYQRYRKSYDIGVTINIRLKLMKSEAIEEEDTTADPAVCEH